MRISVKKDDPGYTPEMALRRFEVLFNGVPLRHCVTADEGAGEAVVHDLDANGRPMLDRERRQVVTRTVRGHIVIRRRA